MPLLLARLHHELAAGMLGVQSLICFFVLFLFGEDDSLMLVLCQAVFQYLDSLIRQVAVKFLLLLVLLFSSMQFADLFSFLLFLLLLLDELLSALFGGYGEVLDHFLSTFVVLLWIGEIFWRLNRLPHLNILIRPNSKCHRLLLSGMLELL